MSKKIFLYTILFFLQTNFSFSQTEILKLDTGWKFAEEGKNIWYKGNVCSNVHYDLFKNKIIEDPYAADNEKRLQWIENKNWIYKNEFIVNSKLYNKKNIKIVFEGLDTYTKIFLNDSLLGGTENMFRSYEFDIKKFLVTGKNILRIEFFSAENMAKELAEKLPYTLPGENRVFVRKAQFHWGWDFAPRLVTCGIYKNIYIKSSDEKFGNEPIWKFGNEKKNIIKLAQEKDSIGESFYITVNGKPTFIRGINYIPSSYIFPRDSNYYIKLFDDLHELNVNMIRVWGGGVYECDLFYKLCEKYNIMVWQDFMFGCAMYPSDENFIENVTEEVRQQVRRLSKFNCIALWCGNNENDEGWKNWGWQKQYNYSEKDSIEIYSGNKKLFEEIIPRIVRQIAPGCNYISSSPKIGWGRKESMTDGDAHYWGVWWGKEPFEMFRKKVPRFMSEYGMQSLPEKKSLEKFCINAEGKIDSVALKNHQKHATGFETIEHYMKLYFDSVPTNFDEYIYKSEVLQCIAIENSVGSQMLAQPHCMGTMLWQLNDCWPAISWSIIDYYGNKKPAFYKLKKLYSEKIDRDFFKIKKLKFITEKDTQYYSLRTIFEDGKSYPVVSVSGKINSKSKTFKPKSNHYIKFRTKEKLTYLYFDETKINFNGFINLKKGEEFQSPVNKDNIGKLKFFAFVAEY